MNNIDRQKEIEKEVDKINQRYYKSSLTKHKQSALFIDPVPDNFLTNRMIDSKLD
jgi:hypothetical protein